MESNVSFWEELEQEIQQQIEEMEKMEYSEDVEGTVDNGHRECHLLVVHRQYGRLGHSGNRQASLYCIVGGKRLLWRRCKMSRKNELGFNQGKHQAKCYDPANGFEKLAHDAGDHQDRNKRSNSR